MNKEMQRRRKYSRLVMNSMAGGWAVLGIHFFVQYNFWWVIVPIAILGQYLLGKFHSRWVSEADGWSNDYFGESKMKFQVYTDKAGEWRWRLVANNSNIIATSGEGYKQKGSCLAAIDSVKAAEAITKVIDENGEDITFSHRTSDDTQ